MRDASRISMVLNGETAHFAALVEHYAPLAFGLCLAHSPDFEAMKGTLVDAFADAYRRLPDLREPERFAPWLAGIIRQRVHRHHQPSNTSGPASSPATVFLGEWMEAWQTSVRVRGRINPRQAEVVAICRILGIDKDTAARFLDISASELDEALQQAATAIDPVDWTMLAPSGIGSPDFAPLIQAILDDLPLDTHPTHLSGRRFSLATWLTREKLALGLLVIVVWSVGGWYAVRGELTLPFGLDRETQEEMDQGYWLPPGIVRGATSRSTRNGEGRGDARIQILRGSESDDSQTARPLPGARIRIAPLKFNREALHAVLTENQVSREVWPLIEAQLLNTQDWMSPLGRLRVPMETRREARRALETLGNQERKGGAWAVYDRFMPPIPKNAWKSYRTDRNGMVFIKRLRPGTYVLEVLDKRGRPIPHDPHSPPWLNPYTTRFPVYADSRTRFPFQVPPLDGAGPGALEEQRRAASGATAGATSPSISGLSLP